jgi:SAM-dependent methyltransferase
MTGSAARVRSGAVRRLLIAGITSVTGLFVRVRLGHPKDRAKVAGMAWWYRAAEAGERHRHQVYRAMYFLGLTPWTRDTPHPFLVRSLTELRAEPGDRALELGCGSGTNAVFLAAQGWDVTAVDIVPRALAQARERARAEHVPVTLVRGDVTRLDGVDRVTGEFRLLVDVGCFHAIPARERDGYVRGVTAVAAPGATLLLIGQFARPARDSRKAGVTLAEIEQRFDGWSLEHRERLSTSPQGELPADHVSEWFEIWHYRLRRAG